ncbi:MAG: CRISPR-associated endonuclease Cas1 [Candidatus Wallbacteria bacterium]|nr:CRISPR-associated endonuclease Cas1 [Candidatus Wallbacteria bacterium]
MESPTSLYVTEQGAHLHRVGGRLLVRDSHGVVLQDVPVFRLDRVMLFGNIEVTTQAFLFLAESGIDLVYLTRDGRFRCRAIGLKLDDAQLRQEQCRLSGDPARRLLLARRLVAAKILNGRSMLRRRAGPEGVDDFAIRCRLKQVCLLRTSVRTACTIERALMRRDEFSAGWYPTADVSDSSVVSVRVQG